MRTIFCANMVDSIYSAFSKMTLFRSVLYFVLTFDELWTNGGKYKGIMGPCVVLCLIMDCTFREQRAVDVHPAKLGEKLNERLDFWDSANYETFLQNFQFTIHIYVKAVANP